MERGTEGRRPREPMDTVAGNPGRVDVSLPTFAWHHPAWTSTGLGATALTAGLVAVTPWYLCVLWGVPYLLVMAVICFLWWKAKVQFSSGNANPGLIIAPGKYAVLGDLSMGVGSFPVVKVVRRHFRPVAGRQTPRGTRIMTVALYTPGEELPHWVDFDPQPVDVATRSRSQIERSYASVREEDWVRLEAALDELPPSPEPGIHVVHVRTSSWASMGDPTQLIGRVDG